MGTEADTCPRCGAKRSRFGRRVALVLVIIVVGLALRYPSTHVPVSTPKVSNPAISTPPPLPVQLEDAKALASLQIANLGWYRGGFDNIMLVNITLLNKGNRDVKDVEITCEHYSNSGTNIDRNQRVIYEIVPAKKTKSVKDFNMGFIHPQAAKTGCYISNLIVIP